MPISATYLLPSVSNVKARSSPYQSTYTTFPPTPPHTTYPDCRDEVSEDNMDLTEENVDDLVNQWWFTNPSSEMGNQAQQNQPEQQQQQLAQQQSMLAQSAEMAAINEEALSVADSPLLNSPLSSTSLENNFEGLGEFPFYSNSNENIVNSPRSPRYDCIAISSSTDPTTPMTDGSTNIAIKQEPIASPILPPVIQSRGPGRPRKNANLNLDGAVADADSHSSKRKRHSQIERRYRCRLQAGMDSLGEVLPSTHRKDRENREYGESSTSAAAGPRSRKASILIDAREYILELEADKRLLAAENESLKAEISRMKRQRMKETNYYAS